MLADFPLATPAIHILVDCWLIAIPIRTLLSIQRPAKEKVGLVVIFGMGVFSTIAAIVRLYFVGVFVNSKDPFREAALVNLWSMVEVNVAIICASAPTLKCLISRSQRERNRHAIEKRSNSFVFTKSSEYLRDARTPASVRPESDSTKGIRMEWTYEQQYDKNPEAVMYEMSDMSTTVNGAGIYPTADQYSPNIDTARRYSNFDQRQYP